MESVKARGIVLSLIASFCGACVPIFSKLILQYFVPSFALLLRMSFSSLLIFVIAKYLFKIKFVVNKQTLIIALFGSLNFVFFMLAINFMPAHISPIFYSLVPIEVTLFSFIIFRDKITFIKLLGILIGYVGALFIIYPSLSNKNSDEIKIVGIVLIIIASCSVALYSLFLQKSNNQYSPYNLSFQSIFLSFIFSIPVAGISHHIHSDKSYNNIVLLYLLGIAAIGTIGQYVVFQKAIAEIHLSANVIFFYFQPFFVLVMSVIFLDEKIKATYFIGLIFVLFGSSLNILTKSKDKGTLG